MNTKHAIFVLVMATSLRVHAAPLRLGPTLAVNYDAKTWAFHEMSVLAERAIPTLELKSDPKLRVHFDVGVDSIPKNRSGAKPVIVPLVETLCAQQKINYGRIDRNTKVDVKFVAPAGHEPYCFVQLTRSNQVTRQYLFVSLFSKPRLAQRSYLMHAMTMSAPPKVLMRNEKQVQQLVAQVGAQP
jgi:hypothetical protein